MPAYIKCQPLPDGSKQFVFCTKEVGGHDDLIGGVEDFDDFLRETMGLATEEKTPFGKQLDDMAITVVQARRHDARELGRLLT